MNGSASSGSLRTLVYHDGALGDVLLSLPCLQVMRAGRDELHFVGRTDIGRLLAELGAVDDFTSSDSRMFATLFASGADERARAFLGRFDRAFLFAVSQDPVLMKNLRGVLPEVRAISTVPPGGTRTHVTEFRLRQLAGTSLETVQAGLVIPLAVRDAALKRLICAGHDGRADLITIHPGSGGKKKCWPLERYFETARRLSAGAGAFILFLSGPAEEPAMRKRIDQFVTGREQMAHVADADLAAVAGLLCRCDLLLGNDSGISHLAAAAGCPVITLFGPTDPVLWRPRGPDVQVIAADAVGAITADQVAGAVEARLSGRARHHGAA